MANAIIPIEGLGRNAGKSGAPKALETAFIAGRDLAIALLTEGQAIDESPAEDVYPHRGFRRGMPLNSFAEKYLQQLVVNPALIHGFAAVLSCDIATGDVMNVEKAYKIPMAEYLPGVVGADGTECMDVDGEPLASPAYLADVGMMLDELHSSTSYAKTYAHMLYDLVGADDNVPDLDINDPEGRTQRMYASLVGLQQKLGEIEITEDGLRSRLADSKRTS